MEQPMISQAELDELQQQADSFGPSVAAAAAGIDYDDGSGVGVVCGASTTSTSSRYTLPASMPTSIVFPNNSLDVDSTTDSNRDTALTLGCAGGHDDMVRLLISRGANIGVYFGRGCPQGP